MILLIFSRSIWPSLLSNAILGGLIAGGYCIGGELSLYSRGKVVLYFNPTYQHHDKRRYALDKITEVIIHAQNQS